jgi:hypothetical protein
MTSGKEIVSLIDLRFDDLFVSIDWMFKQLPLANSLWASAFISSCLLSLLQVVQFVLQVN